MIWTYIGGLCFVGALFAAIYLGGCMLERFWQLCDDVREIKKLLKDEEAE